jgi:hypothetical protein
MDQTVRPCDEAVLDGGQSFDPDEDPITYQWDLITAPEGSHAALSSDHGSRIFLATDVSGMHLVRLTVSDGEFTSDPDIVRVNNSVGNPTSQDLKLCDIVARGVDQHHHVEHLSACVANLGNPYDGPLSFAVWVLDSWEDADLVFSKTVNWDAISLDSGEARRLDLVQREIEWPEEVCQAVFGVVVDPGEGLDEKSEENNSLSRVIYRDELVDGCSYENLLAGKISVISRAGAGHLWWVREDQEFIFPSAEVEPFVIVLDFRDCCPERTFDLSIVYDWTPDPDDGENLILARERGISLKPGESNEKVYNIRILRMEKFSHDYTTFAVIAEDENGSAVLFQAPTKAEYVEIHGGQ